MGLRSQLTVPSSWETHVLSSQIARDCAPKPALARQPLAVELDDGAPLTVHVEALKVI